MTSGARLRVVFLTHSLGVGGAEELILNLVARLPRERYEPIVCSFENPPGPMAAEIAAHGVEVVPLGIAPGWRHPVTGRTVAELIADLGPAKIAPMPD